MSQIPAPLNLEPAKVDADFAFLLDIFREVLADLGAEDVAEAIPWGGSGASMNDGAGDEAGFQPQLP